MTVPLAVSHIVMSCDAADQDASRGHLASLLRDHHLPQPGEHSTHLRMDIGAFRIRWELHTEFVTWSFSCPVDQEGEPTHSSALDAVPVEWFSLLPGRCLASVHLWVLPASQADSRSLTKHLLREETLVGSTVAGGQAEVYTDFAMHPDGFTRMVLLARSITPRHLGRLVQQLLEIDTYRMAALLGLPAAREASAVLGHAERELAGLSDAIRLAARDDEPQLLDRLTKLAGQVESTYAASHSRFSASAAYFELIDRRISDLDEERLSGLQTIGEFMHRRLSPARSTCAWATRRQDALSQRVSRISSLLRTRVEIEQQLSSQALLATMNRRQGLQLRMQATVEGLSVAAITYYVVGLVDHLAKGALHLGWPWSPELTAACAIPVVALTVWWSLHRLHHRIRDE